MEQVKNKFFVCWEQFKKIGGAYQHDGFDNWRLVSYFYERMSLQMKQLLKDEVWR